MAHGKLDYDICGFLLKSHLLLGRCSGFLSTHLEQSFGASETWYHALQRNARQSPARFFFRLQSANLALQLLYQGIQPVRKTPGKISKQPLVTLV